MKHYILDNNGSPVEEPDLLKWARWFEQTERHVRDETFRDSRISTVFLGTDVSFGEGRPILWETMVFGGPLNEGQDRCSGSREHAEAMHKTMVETVRQSYEPKP